MNHTYLPVRFEELLRASIDEEVDITTTQFACQLHLRPRSGLFTNAVSLTAHRTIPGPGHFHFNKK